MHERECAPFYVLDGPAANTAWGKEMKKNLMALAMAVVGMLVAWAETPTVTDVTAKQRYPWNGLVDITCKVSGIEADSGGYEFAVVAINNDTGRGYTVSTFSLQHNGEDVFEVGANGDYSLLWNAREDMGQVVFERMTVRITLEALAVSVRKFQLWEGGPYWAERNIGAKKPTDSGLYFWWGDTKGHRPSGTEFNYKFFDDSDANCPTREMSIATLLSKGWIVSRDGAYVLTSTHDAAYVKWGGGWRMPTKQELYDLFKKCDRISVTMNGVNGVIVQGRGAYASNSIFLPASGGGYKTSLRDYNWHGYYRSSSPADDPFSSSSLNDNSSWIIFFQHLHDSNDNFCYSDWRFGGYTIRPVKDSAK